MKKKLYSPILCVTLGAVAFGLALSSFGNIKESILRYSHSSIRRNQFVINHNSEVSLLGDDDFGNHVYSAVALSGGNSLQTLFVGFNTVNDKLVLSAGDVGIITNYDPMNVGFNLLSVTWTGSNNEFTYSTVSAFSYFRFAEDDFYENIDAMANGAYADLETYAHTHVTATGTFTETVNTSKLPGILDTRHVVSVITADADLTLEEVVFGTECVAQVPVVSEIGTYSDYRQSEKDLIEDVYGFPVPFVGNGLYYMYQQGNDIYIEGAFVDDDLVEPVLDGFDDLDYIVTLSTDPTAPLGFGRIVEQSTNGTDFFTADIQYCANAIVTYKIKLTTDAELIGYYEDWPDKLFEDNLSTEFASFVKSNPLEDEEAGFFDITDLALGGYQDDSQNFLAIAIFGYSSYQEAFNALIDYLTGIANDTNNDYVISKSEIPSGNPRVYEDGEEYELQITDGVHTFYASYSEDIVVLLFNEPVLVNAFPTTLVNETLGLPQGRSVIPFGETGRFNYREREGATSIDIYVYESNLESVFGYRNALLAAGLTSYGQNSGYFELRSDVFDGYSVNIDYRDISTTHKITLSFRRNNDLRTANSFSDALAIFTSDSTILDHVFPTISGDHVYRVVTNSYNSSEYKLVKGIYISDLGQSYINDLLLDAEYNAYYNAYLFEDETDGSNTLAIRYEVLTSGVRIEPLMIAVDQTIQLLDSVDANVILQNNFDSSYDYLAQSQDPDDQAKYAKYVQAFTLAPNSNGEKVYMVDSTSPSFTIYGANAETYADAYTASAESKGFTYSRLQNRYYFGSDDQIRVFRDDSIDSNNDNTSIRFSFVPTNSDTYVFADFTSYADANLADIENNFVSFPHNGNEKIFYHASGSNKVVVETAFDNRQFVLDLIADGFYYYSTGTDDFELRKSDGTTMYKVVASRSGYLENTYSTYYSDARRFYVYTFDVVQNYYTTFASEISDYDDVISARYLNALPTYTNNDNSFHIEDCSPSSVTFSLSEDVNQTAVVNAFLNAGFTGNDASSLHYNGEDFRINCHFYFVGSWVLYIYFEDYTWQSFPTTAQSMNTLYYFASSYIPTPDETGNIFATPTNYTSSSFYFVLKNTVDIESYISKLSALNYTINRSDSSRLYVHFNLSNETIQLDGYIDETDMGYAVSFNCYNYESLTKSVDLYDLNTYFARLGYAGLNVMDVTYSVNVSQTSYGEYWEEKVEYIQFYMDNADIEALKTYIAASSLGYTIEQNDFNTYSKVVGDYKVSIYFGYEYIDFRVTDIR